MTQPAEPAPLPPSEGIVQVQAGLAETPLGQRVAIIITALLPRGQAEAVAKGILEATGRMSGAGLIVAGNGMVPKDEH